MQRDPQPESLSPGEQDDLRCLAAIIVPASETYGVPAASDDKIFADILASLGRDTAAIKSALGLLARSANTGFAALDAASQKNVAARFKEANASAAALLGRVVFQCYYRDDRVLTSLNIEPRAPFPKGNVFEEGDWSVLDVARRRDPSWRRVE